jgi:hypothetical protein
MIALIISPLYRRSKMAANHGRRTPIISTSLRLGTRRHHEQLKQLPTQQPTQIAHHFHRVVLPATVWLSIESSR